MPAFDCECRFGAALQNFNRVFVLTKPFHRRLSISMKPPNTPWETWPQPHGMAASVAGNHKEWKVKLSLETRNRGDVIIVQCSGRIVYRDEAAALSRLAGEVLHNSGKMVLDLSGVSSIDSAGIGELALLYTFAQSRNADLKLASPSPIVRDLLDLTNLGSVLDIHPTVNEALAAFHPQGVCVEC